MMDLLHLRSFAEVALRGTVAAAAQARGYTAPAVSQHLAKLEADLGVDLFERTSGRLHVSHAGAELLPIALSMLDLEEQGRAAVQQQPERPHLTIAGFASAISTLVVPRLAELVGHMTLRIVEAEDDDALRDLRLGHVDVVLTQEYDVDDAERDPRLDHTELVTDRLRLVMPAGRSTSTRIDHLGDERWLFNGPGTRCTRAAVRLLAAAGLSPASSGTIADNEALLALVAAGHGVAIVPELVVGAGRHGITLAAQDLGVSRTILAVTRPSTTAAARPLIEALSAHVPA